MPLGLSRAREACWSRMLLPPLLIGKVAQRTAPEGNYFSALKGKGAFTTHASHTSHSLTDVLLTLISWNQLNLLDWVAPRYWMWRSFYIYAQIFLYLSFQEKYLNFFTEKWNFTTIVSEIFLDPFTFCTLLCCCFILHNSILCRCPLALTASRLFG